MTSHTFEVLPRDKRITINFTNLLCLYTDRREPCSTSAIGGESSSLLQIAWFNVLAINSSWNQHRDNVSTIRNGGRKLLDFSDVQPWPVFFSRFFRFAQPPPLPPTSWGQTSAFCHDCFTECFFLSFFFTIGICEWDLFDKLRRVRAAVADTVCWPLLLNVPRLKIAKISISRVNIRLKDRLIVRSKVDWIICLFEILEVYYAVVFIID